MVKWTKEEIKIIKENYQLSTVELMTLLPGRTPHAIMNKGYKLGLTYHNVPKDLKKNVRKEFTAEHKKKLKEASKRWWSLNKNSEFVKQRNQKISRIHKGNPNNYALKIKGKRTGTYPHCKWCGKKFYNEPSKKQKFCSNECWIAHINCYGSPKKGRKTTKNLSRDDLIALIGHCEMCGFDDKRILTKHHVDRNIKNNKKENLLLLCPNCHTLEHLFQTGKMVYKSIPPSTKTENDEG